MLQNSVGRSEDINRASLQKLLYRFPRKPITPQHISLIKARLCVLGFEISSPLILVSITLLFMYIHAYRCDYEIRSARRTLISVLICRWECGWVISTLHQSAVLWVELCDSLLPRHQYARSRIVAHLTGCVMDRVGFSVVLLSDFLHKHTYTLDLTWFSGHLWICTAPTCW